MQNPGLRPAEVDSVANYILQRVARSLQSGAKWSERFKYYNSSSYAVYFWLRHVDETWIDTPFSVNSCRQRIYSPSRIDALLSSDSYAYRDTACRQCCRSFKSIYWTPIWCNDETNRTSSAPRRAHSTGRCFVLWDPARHCRIILSRNSHKLDCRCTFSVNACQLSGNLYSIKKNNAVCDLSWGNSRSVAAAHWMGSCTRQRFDGSMVAFFYFILLADAAFFIFVMDVS